MLSSFLLRIFKRFPLIKKSLDRFVVRWNATLCHIESMPFKFVSVLLIFRLLDKKNHAFLHHKNRKYDFLSIFRLNPHKIYIFVCGLTFCEWIFVLRLLRVVISSLLLLLLLTQFYYFQFLCFQVAPQSVCICLQYIWSIMHIHTHVIYVCEAYFNVHIYDFKLYAPDVFIFHDIRA